MTTLTCDVNESAAASDRVFLGFSDLFASIGSAVTVAVLAISALAGTDTALAASTASAAAGPDLVETARASTSVPNRLQATTTAPSAGKAASWAFYDLQEVVLGAANASSSVLTSRAVLALAPATAQGVAAPLVRASTTVAQTGVASSALFGFNELVLASQGVAGSSVVLGRRLDAALTSQGAAGSSVVLAVDRGALAQSSGAATSSTPVSRTVAVSWAVSSGVATGRDLLPTLRSAWVMNTETSGMTRYTDLPVQSLAVVGGKVLGLGDAGLYEFAGDTDAGAAITSSVITGRLTLGSEAVKRLGDMIVSYNATGPMQLRVHVYGGVNQGAYTYAMLPRAADAPRANRMKVGKGLVSKFWQFEWFGVGTRFDVTNVTVDVASSTNRRI